MQREVLKLIWGGGSLEWVSLDPLSGQISSLPRGNMVGVRTPIPGRKEFRADSGRLLVTRAATPSHTEIVVSSADGWVVPLSHKRALETLYAAGTAFTVLESYADPEVLTQRLGCVLDPEAPPEFREVQGTRREYFTFSFVILGGI